MPPGSAQPSDPSLHVICSARDNTTAFSATLKRFAASVTTARRTARGNDAVATGVPPGKGATVPASGMRVGGATPVSRAKMGREGKVLSAAPADTAPPRNDRHKPRVLIRVCMTVYKRRSRVTGVA